METATPETSTPRPGANDRVLVDPGWLEAHLSDPRVRVIEVDVSRGAYDDWHIDGAVLWNVYADLKDADYRLVDIAALERLVARSGIGPDSTVVFYGYAPALGFWLMKLCGHPDVRILDCSRDTWRAEGYRWSTVASEPPSGCFSLADPDTCIRADQFAVSDAISQPGTTLIDVRSKAEYCGERFWPSGGTEPGGLAGHVRPDGPLQFFIMDEAVVRRVVGSEAALRRQLQHVIDVSDMPKVTVEIVPFTAGLFPGLQGQFLIYEFPDAADDDVLYLEDSRGALLSRDSQDEILTYREKFEQLREGSLGPAASAELLRALVGKLR